ncbi:unnamed protein product [Rhizophagus irregularis]|nr:unnamed protein product [Rhizophagus irregularis]
MTDYLFKNFIGYILHTAKHIAFSPLSKINASRILSNELGINSKEKPTEEKPATCKFIKTPPPVPPKARFLEGKTSTVIKEEPVPEEPPVPVEEQDKPIDSFSDCYLSDEEPDQEEEPPAKESIPEADDDYDVLDDLLSDPAPE